MLRNEPWPGPNIGPDVVPRTIRGDTLVTRSWRAEQKQQNVKDNSETTDLHAAIWWRQNMQSYPSVCNIDHEYRDLCYLRGISIQYIKPYLVMHRSQIKRRKGKVPETIIIPEIKILGQVKKEHRVFLFWIGFSYNVWVTASKWVWEMAAIFHLTGLFIDDICYRQTLQRVENPDRKLQKDTMPKILPLCSTSLRLWCDGNACVQTIISPHSALEHSESSFDLLMAWEDRKMAPSTSPAERSQCKANRNATRARKWIGFRFYYDDSDFNVLKELYYVDFQPAEKNLACCHRENWHIKGYCVLKVKGMIEKIEPYIIWTVRQKLSFFQFPSVFCNSNR